MIFCHSYKKRDKKSREKGEEKREGQGKNINEISRECEFVLFNKEKVTSKEMAPSPSRSKVCDHSAQAS